MISEADKSMWSNLFHIGEAWEVTVATLWAVSPLFNGIPKKEILKLAKNMHPRRYETGETIFRANDMGAGAALILKGKVEIRSGDITLATLGPGNYFGEISLVLDERRTADAIAVESSELAFFLRLDLEEWIAKAPHHGAKLSTNLAHVLAQRLLHANLMLARSVEQP